MTSIISTNVKDDSRVLLLGAGGRLGRMLWENWPVAGQLKGQSRRKLEGMLQFDPLCDPEKLASAMESVAAVVCLSGVTPAHARASGDSMDLNKTLALAAVNSAPEGVRVFVASSAAVYGAAVGPHREDTNVVPVSEYGAAKLAMEQAALAQGQGRTCVLRIGNVAGADAILGGWQEGMALDELPDGSTPRRSYIGARSLAHVVHRLCFADDLPQIINIAAPGVVAMGDLLDAAGLAWSRRPSSDQTIPEVALDTNRVEQFYSFKMNECTPKGMVEQLYRGEARTE